MGDEEVGSFGGADEGWGTGDVSRVVLLWEGSGLLGTMAWRKEMSLWLKPPSVPPM